MSQDRTPDHHEWMAVQMGLTVREVQGMLLWRDLLTEMGIGIEPEAHGRQADTRFELGLNAWAREREKRLHLERAQATAPDRKEQLLGQAVEAIGLVASLTGMVAILNGMLQQFSAVHTLQEPPAPSIYPTIS